MEEDLGAGVAAVGRIVAGVPVTELVPDVSVAALGCHLKAGNGVGQRQCLGGVGECGSDDGQDHEGGGSKTAQNSVDHALLIAGFQRA